MGLYARVAKCSHTASDALVTTMDKIRVPLPTPQSSTSSVKLLDFIGRHDHNYTLELIANQHLTKILCEPLCPKAPMENYADYCRNECDLQQVHIPLHPLYSPLHIGKSSQESPFRTGAEGAQRGRILMLVLPESFQHSQLSGPGAVRSKLRHYCREQNDLPKRKRKVCQKESSLNIWDVY